MWREPVDFSTNSVVTPTFSGVSLTKFKRTVLKTVENQFAMLTLGGKHKDAYRAQSVEHTRISYNIHKNIEIRTKSPPSRHTNKDPNLRGFKVLKGTAAGALFIHESEESPS